MEKLLNGFKVRVHVCVVSQTQCACMAVGVEAAGAHFSARLPRNYITA